MPEPLAALSALLLAATPAPETLAFATPSADGTPIHGQADRPAAGSSTAVIFVPGTGAFDRDAAFGTSGGPRDLVFKDLAGRLNAAGVTTVRFDLRGIRHGVPAAQRLDRALLAGRTTETMRADLAAVYNWTRSPQGPAARCVVFLAHSEGMYHVSRLAAAGAPAPLMVVGMGAAMETPRDVFRWQLSEREAHSLELMDADGDGRTTDEEVRAGLSATPAAVFGRVEPYLHPSGAWTADDLARLRTMQATVYEQTRTMTLAREDADPYPDADTAFATWQWWKSWYLDEAAGAAALATWDVPVRLHYGDRDSQTMAERQIAAARAALPAARLAYEVHPGRGHTLGPNVLYGPMDEAIADRIAAQIAQAAQGCS